ncbi:MAG: hypothetical protein ACREQ9_04840 [Candidatus Binatia bacterium]
MREELRAMLFGGFFGALATAGLLFVAFWWVLFSSPNAGAMVDGAFRPYREDSSGYAIALGGTVLLAGGVGGLAWGWRRLGRGRTL